MQPLPPEQQPQDKKLQDDTANDPPNDGGVVVANWVHPLPVINEERYVMSESLAAGSALSVPALAHTRRSEHDARIEGTSPYRLGDEKDGMSGEDPGSVGVAYGGVEEPVARVGMENERNVWTTVSTFANNGLLDSLTRKPGRELTQDRTSKAPAQPAHGPTTPSTEGDFTDIDLHGEPSGEGETLVNGETDEKKREKRKSDKTKEQRARERREKALSETSAKLEGTWEGYGDQQRLETEIEGAIDYSGFGFK